MVAAPSRLPERGGGDGRSGAGSGSAGVGAGRGAWGSPGHGCVGGVGCGSAGSRGNGWVGGPVFRFVMGCPVSDQGAGGRAVRAGRWSRRHPSRPGGRCWTSPLHFSLPPRLHPTPMARGTDPATSYDVRPDGAPSREPRLPRRCRPVAVTPGACPRRPLPCAITAFSARPAPVRPASLGRSSASTRRAFVVAAVPGGRASPAVIRSSRPRTTSLGPCWGRAPCAVPGPGGATRPAGSSRRR